jgi:tetratricopeptide (TPR) repeat protein
MHVLSKPVSGSPLAGFLLALLVSGCAINPDIEVAELAVQPTKQLEPPFFPQEEYQCGPAALAGVLNASRVSISAESLVGMVYLPGRQGSLQLELLTATRRLGRVAYVLEPDPTAVFAEISAGRPVLILQNLGTRNVPVWHYAVVTGFDAGKNTVSLNSGVNEGLEVSARKWLRTWDWADRWAMIALRPGELPAADEFQPYAEALSSFERFADEATRAAAWNKAREHWPGEPAPYLALGNLAYGRQDRKSALDLFSAGLALNPEDPALSNNLASVRAESGCRDQAMRVIEHGLAKADPDSPWVGVLQETLDEIQAQPIRREETCKLANPSSQ